MANLGKSLTRRECKEQFLTDVTEAEFIAALKRRDNLRDVMKKYFYKKFRPLFREHNLIKGPRDLVDPAYVAKLINNDFTTEGTMKEIEVVKSAARLFNIFYYQFTMNDWMATGFGRRYEFPHDRGDHHERFVKRIMENNRDVDVTFYWRMTHEKMNGFVFWINRKFPDKKIEGMRINYGEYLYLFNRIKYFVYAVEAMEDLSRGVIDSFYKSIMKSLESENFESDDFISSYKIVGKEREEF